MSSLLHILNLCFVFPLLCIIWWHHNYKLDVVEIQVLVVAIQAGPVEIQVNVVELHLSSVITILLKYMLDLLKNKVALTCISTGNDIYKM